MNNGFYEDELGTLEELGISRRIGSRRTKRMPYDYVVSFTLSGNRGNRIPGSINITSEARFVCTSIGYGVQEPESFTPPGVRERVPLVFTEPSVLPAIQLLRELLSFKYAIIDVGSGRELQSAAVFNLAGLGRADGDRPFRELTVPYIFAPNSTIVIELEEVTTLSGAIVHIVFQGFKEFR